MSTVTDYLILIEGDSATNYSAWSPDLPGCVATGGTVKQTVTNMHGAIELHLAGIAEDGDQIPEPSGPGVYVDAHLVAA